MNRIKTIDGLRGLAVLSVLTFHYINNSFVNSNPIYLNKIEIWISKLTSIGWAGVDLFFVISGYLIGRILFSNLNKLNFFKTFYIRRFCRIIPIYFLLLISYFIISQIFQNQTHIILFEKPIPLVYYFTLIQNFYMSSYGHFGPNALTPTWSLAVEEQFYIVIPFLIYFIKEKKIPYVIFCLIGLSILFRYFSTNWYMEYTHTLSRIDAPLLGVLLAYSKSYKGWVNEFLNSKTIMIIIIIILSLLYVYFKQLNHTLIAVIFTICLQKIIQLEKSIFYDILTSKILLFFGKYSYFIYLFHTLINGLFFLIVKGTNPCLHSADCYFITAFSLCVTCILAKISFNLIESKFIAFSHKFNYQSK